MDIDDLYDAAIAGDADAIAKLEMEADTLDKDKQTILHKECWNRNTERVRFILREFAHKHLLVKLNVLQDTALQIAAGYGRVELVEVLIDAARRNLPSSLEANDDPHNQLISSFEAFVRHADWKGDTALHKAVDYMPNTAIVKLLVEADPSDKHIQNNDGKTPIYIAAEKGYKHLVKVICTTCTALSFDGPDGTTALHAAIKKIEEESEVVEVIIDAARRNLPSSSSAADNDPNNQLISSFEAFVRHADRNGNTALHEAVMRHKTAIVKLLVEADPSDKHIQNNDGKTPIYIAVERGYKDIVKVICTTCTALFFDCPRGATILHAAVKKMDQESVFSILGCAKHLVTRADDRGWTPLDYAASQEFDSVLEALIKAENDVGFQYNNYWSSSTPLHLAAEKGYTSTVIRLAQLWPVSRSYVAVNKEGRNILHLAAVQSKKEMIQGILKYCPEERKDEIVNKHDSEGNTPLHLLISKGCFVPELIKYKGLDKMAKNKESWTPRDMLYFQEEIIADQVQIKIALDHIQTNKYWKFWSKTAEKENDIWQSVVLPSKREAKDVLFEDAKKTLMDEKRAEKKKELERYKKRTNTQIIVTALITTVTFTVGFTMPGGLHQSGELDQGLVILSKKKAFNAFMVSDALALLLSTSSLFLYFLESMYEDPQQVSKINAASTGLNIVSVMAMMLTFITGTYVVLSHSPALAISVCLIGSFFFLFVIVLLIKMVYDRQVERNEG